MKAQTLKEILDAPFASDLTVSRDGKTIAWVENVAGARNVFVGSGNDFSTVTQLTNYLGDQGVSLGNLIFSADGKNLIFVRGNTKNNQGEPANPALLQENTEQTIYMQGLDVDTLVKISAGASPKLSHDGSKLGFIKGGQVWVAHLLENSIQPKELFRVRGRQSDIKWSPDDCQVAFTSSRGDHAYIGVYDINGNTVQFLDPSVDNDFSPEWSPNGQSIAFIRQPNAKEVAPFTPQKVGHPWSIRRYDLQTEATKTIWKADEGMGSVYFGQFPELALEWTTNDELVFPWEKEGWMHLYALNIHSGEVTTLTKGDGIVEDYTLSEDRKTLVYTTNIGDLHRRHVGQIHLPSKKATMLTSGTSSEFSPALTAHGVVFLKTSAQHTSRPAILLGGNVQFIGNRTAVFEHQNIPDVLEIEATDGKSFNATIFYPKQYNKRKKHPAVIFLHGGSKRQMLQTYHYSSYYSNAFALQQYFASQGYIAMMINYRSGIGYGTDFREADNYGITGASEVNDLIGAGTYLASRADVDSERIALWGGSYGGYLTAHGLARRSDLFAVGVDIHGVHNWNTELPTFASWYHQNHYPEIAALALESSPEAYLEGWKSPVLLIHGDDDRNVPFSETVVLSEQLRDRGVYFEQMIFPDEVHGFLLHQNWVNALEATYEFINRFIGKNAE
jgi:dipeptidyl aminopeptidase/acylaminoacyl peptidase